MDRVKLFREYTRELEFHLAVLNQSDCCQCGINESQCFLIVEIGRKPGISNKELAEIVGLDKSGISHLLLYACMLLGLGVMVWAEHLSLRKKTA